MVDLGGSLLGVVIGEEDDRAVEHAIVQRGVGEQELAFQLDGHAGLGGV